MKLINHIHTGSSMEQAFIDLDILKLLAAASPSFKEPDASIWAQEHFESDPDELSARYRLFSDLDDLSEAEAAYQACLHFEAEQDKLNRTADVFHETLYRYRVLSAYLAYVDALKALSAHAASSSRLKALKTRLTEIEKDPTFTTISSVVAEVPRILPFPRHLFVAINAKEDGTATEIGVLRDDRLEHVSDALLNSEAPSGPSESLFPDMKYTRAQYGTHFEEYLVQHFEKHYHSEASKAHKLLQNVDPVSAAELLELRESLRFLVIGLSMHRLFTTAGYALCQPDPNGSDLAAEALMYPDLALHMENLEGKKVRLRSGSSTLITGANHSGKTSYLKTIGQSLILGQFGFFVPAESFSFRPFQQIYTLFSSGEDNSMSVSRMGVEIQRLKVIMNSASSDDLVLINEPMTSTNPVEAVSICGDLMDNFLEKHITHLVVTHLYDIYYLLMARLSDEKKALFESLITISRFDPSLGMIHSYRLVRQEPQGNSYALETAKSFQITLEDLLDNETLLKEAAAYCRVSEEKNIYAQAGKEAAHGISD